MSARKSHRRAGVGPSPKVDRFFDAHFGSDFGVRSSASLRRVPVPELVRISHEPEHRTATIGRYSDGQFYAVVHGAQRDDDRRRLTPEGSDGMSTCTCSTTPDTTDPRISLSW